MFLPYGQLFGFSIFGVIALLISLNVLLNTAYHFKTSTVYDKIAALLSIINILILSERAYFFYYSYLRFFSTEISVGLPLLIILFVLFSQFLGQGNSKTSTRGFWLLCALLLVEPCMVVLLNSISRFL